MSFIPDEVEGEYRTGETLYLYSFAHPTLKDASYNIYAHSKDEAERTFRSDWDNLYTPQYLRRRTW